MPHAHVAAGDEASASGGEAAAHSRVREANLLGALALAVVDRVRAATESGASQGGSAPAALISLAAYLEGRPIDALRGPLGVTHSAAVRVVDRLAGGGLVRRSRGSDRRSVAVELTPAGRGAAERALAARGETLERALGVLSVDERAQLARLHEKLLFAMTDGRVSAGRTCRLCDSEACGHDQGRCPVTRGADAAEADSAA